LNQATVDAENALFWNELCGTSLARALGITDHSLESLRKFDAGYLGFYPYLLERVPVARMRGKRVLEVGLGYGTLGQKIAEAGADYLGLDIAVEPVKMMETRLRLVGLRGKAVQASILDSGLPSEAFDAVVAIGCFHHTGDVQRCFDETHRLLRSGGEAYLMVYNKFSLRQWTHWPVRTAGALLRQSFGSTTPRSGREEERRAYDSGADGAAAPETVFLSKRDVRRTMEAFSRVEISRENSDPVIWRGRQRVSRETMMKLSARPLGLDLYIAAVR
jgi:SAM-dependent methyltransferase